MCDVEVDNLEPKTIILIIKNIYFVYWNNFISEIFDQTWK